MMNKFNEGDKVIVVGVTDLDGDYGDAGEMITDPEHEATLDWQSPPQTLIGQIGEVVDAAMNDYYDLTVRFPWNADNEDCAMKEQDLKLVTGVAYRVTGNVAAMEPQRAVFDHDPSTYPPAAPSLPVTPGREIKVVSESETVANDLAAVWKSKGRDGRPLFENVKVTPVAL